MCLSKFWGNVRPPSSVTNGSAWILKWLQRKECVGYVVWRKSSHLVHVTDTLLIANHNSIQLTQTATVKMEVVIFF